MALWIEVKYANLLSVQLENFKVKQQNPFLANCRCPYCGDSDKSKKKARGYIYTRSNQLNYRCHNCGMGTTFAKVLKSQNDSLFQQYKMEMYKERVGVGVEKPVANVDMNFTPKFGSKPKRLIDKLLPNLNEVEEDNLARQYAVDRQIPKDHWSDLYYIEDVKDIVQLSPGYKKRLEAFRRHPRLVIPFYNQSDRLVGISCRALQGEEPKYVTVRIDEDDPMIFGIDKIDKSKKIYVVEGPFDSMFLPNCVAVGTSDLKKILTYIPKENTILIYDNQPRNREIVKLMRKNIELNTNVVIWPETIEEKDINEMIEAGRTKEQVLDIINNNVYSGIRLKVALAKWGKVSV